ncbi:low molecular weight phosphatase family protein [Microbacterium sp. NPDC055910]|uniref:arsenate reductase/protein-tyrosine-phosphatase family protein n=1 Tax=Microbacterium sp. NPDC055910 TaxID=3345659 RepID=UPI0035DEB3D4
MFEILTVCTGNVCRSPVAEQLLRDHLRDLGATVSSAGTHGLTASPMTPEAQRIAVQLGVTETDAADHRGRILTEDLLHSPDLILTMTRAHRKAVAETAPSRVRSTFTIREFARLTREISPDDVRETVASVGGAPSARVRALSHLVSTMRGVAPPPDDPADDDVIDPYRRAWEIYEQSAAELQPAVRSVVSLIRSALSA